MSNNIYQPPNISGAEGLMLQTEAGVYDATDRWSARMETRVAGLMYGVPGYVRQGTLDEFQALDYAFDMQLSTPQTVSPGSPSDLRYADVYAEGAGLAALTLVGFAMYGSSMSPFGTKSRRAGEEVVHVPTFAVSDRGSERALRSEEMEAIGILLLHRVATDAQEKWSAVDLTYNTEAANYAAFMSRADALGLTPRDHREMLPFAEDVVDRKQMARTELSLPVTGLLTALERNHHWLATQSAVTQ